MARGDSTATRRRYLLKNGFRNCHWCGTRLGRHTLTCEHLVPLSKGGTHRRTNLVAACKPCNAHRGNMDEADYRLKFPKGCPATSRFRSKRNGNGPGLSDPREQLRRRILRAKQRAAERDRAAMEGRPT